MCARKQYFMRIKACTGISVSTLLVRFSVEVLVWYDFKVKIGVGQYAKEKSGCSSASKAYKYMAEPGYLHDIKGNIN